MFEGFQTGSLGVSVNKEQVASLNVTTNHTFGQQNHPFEGRTTKTEVASIFTRKKRATS